MSEEYVHIEPGDEVESIGGRYVVEKELRLRLDGREFLAVIGFAVMDKACCGPGGGCRFAQVAGYILEWRGAVNEAGAAVSRVESVTNEDERRRIHEMIDERELYCQVNFL